MLMAPRHRPARVVLAALICLSGLANAAIAAAEGPAGFGVTPEAVALEGNFARAQLLVTATAADGSVDERSADLTHAAAYLSDNPQVVTVSPAGQLLAVADGTAVISVTAGG